MLQQQLNGDPPYEVGTNGSARLAPPVCAQWGEEELAATLDSVGNGVWALDLEGRCVFINRAACRILGYSRDECLGQKLQCRIHAGHCDGWVCPKEACRVQSALESRSAVQVDDDEFRRRDGTSIAVKYSIQPVVVHGRSRGSVVSMVDITARKRAEEAQRKSDEWLNCTQNAAGVGIFDLDIRTGQARVSEGQFRLYGLDPSGTWPSHEGWLKLVHPEDRERMDLPHELMFPGAQLTGTEFRIVLPDGSIRWLLSRATAFFDDAGRPTRLVGVNVDVTSRVQAETALNQFFSASPTPMAIWGFDGRIRRVNPSWEPILGFTAEQVVGTPLFDRVHPEDRAAAEAEVKRLSISGKRTGFECRVRCNDESYRWLLLNGGVLKNEQVVYVTAQDITERKKAEEALRESEARFRSTFENALFGMAIVGLDLRFLQVNQSLCRITGFAEQELLQTNFAAITHPDDVRETQERKRSLMEGATSSVSATKRYVRKDGQPVWVCAHVAAVRDAQGKPLHFITLVEDLTERKQAEEAARRSEEWLKFALNAAGIGLCYRGSGVTHASEHQFRLYGLDPAEKWLVRERWLQSIHPLDRQRVESEQHLALEQGKPYSFQFRAVWPDGSVHWLRCRGKEFQDGGSVRKAEITLDVTGRKRAEAALEEFFGMSRSPMAILGFDGYIKRANPALLQTWGLTAEELGQRPAIEFFHPDDRPAIQAELRKLMTSGGGAELECRGLRRDGSSAWFLASATAAPDEELIFAVANDITERKRMAETLGLHAEKLARSNEELERFAYVASHDLQEPLRMVASFTQLLSKRYSGKLDETADRYIEYAVDGAKRMQQLIADLLAYSRVNSKEIDPRQADCEALVVAAMLNLRVAIDESGASIDWDQLPEVWVDQAQFIQLFQNLLGNAIKFRPKEAPPRIHISAADTGAEWLFSVQDNGIGIEPKQAERVFQVFQRVHSRAEYPGTGIGLAVCQKVIQRHGGKIWVESELGAGSSFRFTIPKHGRME